MSSTNWSIQRDYELISNDDASVHGRPHS
jgi:hypothetical protein